MASFPPSRPAAACSILGGPRPVPAPLRAPPSPLFPSSSGVSLTLQEGHGVKAASTLASLVRAAASVSSPGGGRGRGEGEGPRPPAPPSTPILSPSTSHSPASKLCTRAPLGQGQDGVAGLGGCAVLDPPGTQPTLTASREHQGLGLQHLHSEHSQDQGTKGQMPRPAPATASLPGRAGAGGPGPRLTKEASGPGRSEQGGPGGRGSRRTSESSQGPGQGRYSALENGSQGGLRSHWLQPLIYSWETEARRQGAGHRAPPGSGHRVPATRPPAQPVRDSPAPRSRRSPTPASQVGTETAGRASRKRRAGIRGLSACRPRE